MAGRLPGMSSRSQHDALAQNDTRTAHTRTAKRTAAPYECVASLSHSPTRGIFCAVPLWCTMVYVVPLKAFN